MKVLSTDNLDDIHIKGVGVVKADFACSFLWDEFIPNIGFTQSGEIRLHPDWETLHLVPWCPGHARVMGIAKEGGSSFLVESRTWLMSVSERLFVEFGVKVMCAFEEEFYLLKEENGCDIPVDKSVYAQASAFEKLASEFSSVAESLKMQGVHVEMMHSESGCGQFEIVWRFTDCIAAGDNHMIAKETIRSYFAKLNLKASFVPKPFKESAGSGSHLHFSLWQGGKSLMDEFECRSSLVHAFVSGVFDHIEGLVALAQPTSNSFERSQPGSWVGAFVAYGYENKECPLRLCTDNVSGSVQNVELKISDGTCNPYLFLGCLLLAGMDGMVRGAVLPHPAVDAPTEATHIRLPATLEEALRALENDVVLMDGMGATLSKCFVGLKQFESKQIIPPCELFDLF